MARNFDLSIGEYYHLYNRGTEKRAIFLSDADRARFLGLLYLCNNITPVHISNYQGSTLMDWLALPLTETIVDIGAYCLMPNHFHLLVREKKEGASVYLYRRSQLPIRCTLIKNIAAPAHYSLDASKRGTRITISISSIFSLTFTSIQ